MTQSTRVLRLRIKDKHSSWLSERAREVNTVWNCCNELSIKVFERQRRFLSGFDFWPFLKGATRGDCAPELPVQTVQEVAEQYARRRRRHRKLRLAGRKSAGARRSLGWIPFKVRTIRYRGRQVYFAGRWLSLWDSYGLADFEPRAGSIRQDARGRWYLNVGVRKGHTAHKCALLEVLADKMPSRGIDLGLEALASISDAQRAPVPSGRQGFGIREWRCVPCGSIHDRDTNAAQNIFAAGHRRLAAGNLSLSEEVDVKARSQRIV